MIKDRFLCVALQICATKETVRIFFLSLHTELILQYIYKHLHKQPTWLTPRKGVFKYYISQVPPISALIHCITKGLPLQIDDSWFLIS